MAWTERLLEKSYLRVPSIWTQRLVAAVSFLQEKSGRECGGNAMHNFPSIFKVPKYLPSTLEHQITWGLEKLGRLKNLLKVESGGWNKWEALEKEATCIWMSYNSWS